MTAEVIPTMVDRREYWERPTRFTVKGRGTFPADMLRHDRCWPVDGDIHAITTEVGGYEATITLCALNRRVITPARWRSFGWVVTDIEGEEVIQ
jgi:hypothetical protein